MKGIYLDSILLALRFKSAAASRMALYQAWAWSKAGGSDRLACRLREIADRTTAAADAIEALVGIFGAYLAPGTRSRRAKA